MLQREVTNFDLAVVDRTDFDLETMDLDPVEEVLEKKSECSTAMEEREDYDQKCGRDR